MRYEMRFFDTSEKQITIGDIESALLQIDPEYRLEVPELIQIPQADLYLREGYYGKLEIRSPGDGFFEDKIAEMLEFLKQSEGKGRTRVEEVLKSTRRIVLVQLLIEGREIVETFDGVDPLWKWLFSTRVGLLQGDGEGYYDANQLVLEDPISSSS